MVALAESIGARLDGRYETYPPPASEPADGRVAQHCILVIYMLPIFQMADVREYVDDRGRSPFGRWFDALDAGAAARVRTALARMEAGNLSNVRGVGGGVLECRINVGPGYRVYFGRDGDTLIVLLGGGTKARQQRDIEDARELWREYRRRKQQEV